jgi:hypothetical protein
MVGSINKKASREKEVRKPGRQTENTVAVQQAARQNSDLLINVMKGYSK